MSQLNILIVNLKNLYLTKMMKASRNKSKIESLNGNRAIKIFCQIKANKMSNEYLKKDRLLKTKQTQNNLNFRF